MTLERIGDVEITEKEPRVLVTFLGTKKKVVKMGPRGVPIVESFQMVDKVEMRVSGLKKLLKQNWDEVKE